MSINEALRNVTPPKAILITLLYVAHVLITRVLIADCNFNMRTSYECTFRVSYLCKSR